LIVNTKLDFMVMSLVLWIKKQTQALLTPKDPDVFLAKMASN
jgi:hypothetical protein